jgi:hypothetical protein
VHDDLPFSFAADYPDNYANMPVEEREHRALIGTDQCMIDEKEFYIRGCLEIPIQNDDRVFLWGLWAAMGPEDFAEVSESWETQGREKRVVSARTKGVLQMLFSRHIRLQP